MPVPKGTMFRYKKGTNIRLAIYKGKVIETKDMKLGKKRSFGFTK